MKRSTPLKPGGPLKGSAFKRTAGREQRTVARIQSKGMRGRSPTVAEQRFIDAIASLGCVACAKDGRQNPFVSIHHLDGRTKPGCHLLVLPLCAGHHQAGTGEDKTLVAVHPDKARFEAIYGTQLQLLAAAKEQLGIA